MRLLISDANILIGMAVSGNFVAYAQQLPGQHNHLLPAKNGPKPSHNDYLSLALAKQEACTLLTVDDAFKALDRMKSGQRRLPWPEAEKVLNALR